MDTKTIFTYQRYIIKNPTRKRETFICTCTLTCNMVIKSVTVTEEAYNALKRMKKSHESFSKAILRISQKREGSASKYAGVLKDYDLKKLKCSIKKRREDIEKEFRERQRKFKKVIE